MDNSFVFANELEVDLVLGSVSFEGGKVDVEAETTGVAFGALDEVTESAIEEASGGSPRGVSTVIKVLDLPLSSWLAKETESLNLVDQLLGSKYQSSFGIYPLSKEKKNMGYIQI